MSDTEVALEALRSDAKVWNQAADSLLGPTREIAAMSLAEDDVMSYAARAGFHRQYNDMRQLLQDMSQQAAVNFDALAEVLRNAAGMYERTEEEHGNRISGVLDGN
ncbi:hypothetical protein ACFWY9_01385 [Amycolatopsis sp. NPDC059027]|uniref:hypothetical protein n=1 Tax=unclassified Amycolatopsis TaxID=2618356 RepID=UPI00366ADC26